jgi:dTDP-4-amino-4,6-dideoxygalactose transaminase
MSLFPIHHTFAPHVHMQYLFASILLLLTPWTWRRISTQGDLKSHISKRLEGEVFLFANGREAFLALLQAMSITKQEEVIVQNYTCTVVPNAIKAAGGHPIYADINEETLNLSRNSVEERISNATHSIVCQHTFGIPSDTAHLRALCDEYSIPLIEDCAHTIPDSIQADFAFFSFGRDKALSGITGGAVLSRNTEVSEKLKQLKDNATYLPVWTVLRLLLYPFIYTISRPLYGIGIGKGILWLAQKIGLLIPIVTQKEKNGDMDPTLHHIPEPCASLALMQWKNLDAINAHRRKLTKFYLEELSRSTGSATRADRRDNRIPAAVSSDFRIASAVSSDLPLQKFPIFIKDAEDIRKKLKKKNIHLSDGWEGCAIIDETGNIASKILNLPTHPTMSQKQARHLITVLSDSLNIVKSD